VLPDCALAGIRNEAGLVQLTINASQELRKARLAMNGQKNYRFVSLCVYSNDVPIAPEHAPLLVYSHPDIRMENRSTPKSISGL
jgi:hypothetical protein